ncbi:tRNA (guanosine(37)-N1)-methyltransferase TrmD [bacterium]|nr:MAG: tRNA (guanosine(37)-N1)-methyltransferase TrmD [bacterium]
MRFDIVSIFPALVEGIIDVGVVGRAVRSGLLDVSVHDLRSFTNDVHRTVDDSPYGGGPGMVLKAEPFMKAVSHIKSKRGVPDSVVLLSPQGRQLSQAVVERMSGFQHIVLLCGRYEGVDERVRTDLVTEELSIGDYVVSGGELPAGIVVDAIARQIPGVVGDADSVVGDSFVRHLLDYPHYTRPESLGIHAVPEVLLSGDHGEIRRWRKQEALKRTLDRRPDLVEELDVEELDAEEKVILKALQSGIR